MISNAEKQARDSLRELVRYVADSGQTLRPITYGDLAARIGRLNKFGHGHGHGMGHILGKMGHLLQDLEGQWGEFVPHLQSLVVNKSGPLKGLPDLGIKEFWKDYPQLSKLEKANKARTEYERILEFGSRWDSVLKALNIPQETKKASKKSGSSRGYGSGGESPQHRALKIYVKNHPELVGAGPGDIAYDEYALPSLDEVDVLFKGSTKWVAVEVKSRVSECHIHDFERGIYQCVKYRAILKAMGSDNKYSVPNNIEVVLVLETELPRNLRPLTKRLAIRLLEGVETEGLAV